MRASPSLTCSSPNKTQQQTNIKNNSTVGGGGLYNGSMFAYTGYPGHPFDSGSRYFRTRQAGKIAFALVNNAPFNVTSDDQALYFDWFVDNPWPYWFVAQTMSLNANGTDIVMHQARVDLYDYDKLKPPGNFSDLARQLFDEYSAEAGDAYAGPVLPPEVVAATPNLASMSTEVPLAQYKGRRLLVAFRLSTNVNFAAFGFDNVMLVRCEGREAAERAAVIEYERRRNARKREEEEAADAEAGGKGAGSKGGKEEEAGTAAGAKEEEKDGKKKEAVKAGGEAAPAAEKAAAAAEAKDEAKPEGEKKQEASKA